MSTVSSDVWAVAAILLGAAAGVAGTVAVIATPQGAWSHAEPCVGLEVPVVMPSQAEGDRVIRWVPTPPRPLERHGASGRSVIIRVPARAPKVRVLRFKSPVQTGGAMIEGSVAELLGAAAEQARVDRVRAQAGEEGADAPGDTNGADVTRSGGPGEPGAERRESGG